MPTTGISGNALPDLGELTYNTITFSSLHRSKLDGVAVQDEAHWTTKIMEYTLVVEGVVTLNPGEANTDATWRALRQNLSQHGGTLVYKGNGSGDLIVNQPGGRIKDVAWGPVPKILYFQTLGGSRSSNISWQVTTRVPELKNPSQFIPGFFGGGTGGGGPGGQAQLRTGRPIRPVLQYNYEASITYDDEGYSGLSIKGTLEIPMTRKSVDDHSLADTVNAYRSIWLNIQLDLNIFRIVRRHFNISRDRRTCEWEFVAEEMPKFGLPIGATNARGTMSARPLKRGAALATWVCSLRATYTIRNDQPQRLAAQAFYSLLWWRMNNSINGIVPPIEKNNNQNQQPGPVTTALTTLARFTNPIAPGLSLIGLTASLFSKEAGQAVGAAAGTGRLTQKAILVDFGFDEGLYLDAKTITFNASWILITTWRALLVATGVWTQTLVEGGQTWALSMSDMMGWRSWLQNNVDQNVDVIVDLSGGRPPGLGLTGVAPIIAGR